MDVFVEVVKEFFIPGSLPFLLFAMVLGLLLLYRGERSRKWGKRWLTCLALAYWILSTPLFARAVETLLSHGYESLSQANIPDDTQALIVLGGGSNTYRAGDFEVNVLSEAGILRVLEGARLYFQMDDPWVIVSGGVNERAGALTPESEPLHDLMLDVGVPASRLLLESASGNTYEQARNVGPLLERHGIDRFILVTSPTHMRRAMATFQAQGLRPIASISAQHAEDTFAESISFLPNADALHASRMAMREILATLYYALAGRF